LGGFSSLWAGDLWSDKPIGLIDVVITKGAVSPRIVGINGNGLIEVIDAFVKAIFGEF
jgi:hypothetical protein